MSGSSNKSFKTAKSYISESSNSRSKEKNILNSIKSQLSEAAKLNAKKKIYKLFVPYIKRAFVNIIDRVNYFLIMKKYLMSIKEKNNCVRLYNIDDNNITYRIGNRIILDKQIGRISGNGIVYLSHFKTNIKFGNKYDKLNKFAVKITINDKYNLHELRILELLTKKVIEFKCPHFPICYGSLKCDNSIITSNTSDDYSIIKDKQGDVKLFPELINKNKEILIQINELASGDLKYYLEFIQNKNMLNTITQILLCIMFFSNYTNSIHNDCHSGNFLFHKIKSGGYFHYNIFGIDYYLENLGYLWVIWDFGLTEFYNLKPINTDYLRIIISILYDKKYYSNIEFEIIFDLITNIINKYNKIIDTNKIKDINIEILQFLLLNTSSFITEKPSNIINKKPYIITDFKPSTKINKSMSSLSYFKKIIFNQT